MQILLISSHMEHRLPGSFKIPSTLNQGKPSLYYMVVIWLWLPRTSGSSKPSVHISLSCLLQWSYYEAHLACHDMLILGRSPLKQRQSLDMTIAVAWVVKK